MVGAGWLSRVGPWVGVGTSPAAMMTGGGVAEGLEGARLLVALGVGAVALTALAAAQGLLGQVTRRPLTALTAGPLGEAASRRTASVVMLGLMVGWFGVNAGVGGVALARLLDAPEPVGVALFSAAILAVVWLGLGALSLSALVAGLATVVLAAHGLSLAFADAAVSLSGPDTATEPIGLTAGVALVVGYGAAFALRAPDFTRDLERPRQVVWCALTGMLAPVLVFVVAGALLQAATGTWDLANVLLALGSSDIAYLFLALGFTGSVLTNLYSGALSLSDAAPAVTHRRALVVVALAGGLLAGVGFSEWMLTYLTVVALFAPGLIVVCGLHALLGRPDVRGVGVAGLGAWGLGVAGGIALYLAGSPLALPAAVALPLVYGLAAHVPLARPRGAPQGRGMAETIKERPG